MVNHSKLNQQLAQRSNNLKNIYINIQYVYKYDRERVIEQIDKFKT